MLEECEVISDSVGDQVYRENDDSAAIYISASRLETLFMLAFCKNSLLRGSTR
jgi:hypothetical protein